MWSVTATFQHIPRYPDEKGPNGMWGVNATAYIYCRGVPKGGDRANILPPHADGTNVEQESPVNLACACQ
jgi:hypothetical protein